MKHPVSFIVLELSFMLQLWPWWTCRPPPLLHVEHQQTCWPHSCCGCLSPQRPSVSICSQHDFTLATISSVCRKVFIYKFHMCADFCSETLSTHLRLREYCCYLSALLLVTLYWVLKLQVTHTDVHIEKVRHLLFSIFLTKYFLCSCRGRASCFNGGAAEE